MNNSSNDSDNPFQPTQFDTFVPPEYVVPDPPEWATYCPRRYGEMWKIHKKKQHASGAMTIHKRKGIALYHVEEVNGVKSWIEVQRHDI